MRNIGIMVCIQILLLCCEFKTVCPMKDKNLTAETRTGANTMSCKIDGKILIDHADNWGDCRGSAGVYKKQNTTRIVLQAKNNNECAPLRGQVDIRIDTSLYNYYKGTKRYKLLNVSYLEFFNVGAQVQGISGETVYNTRSTSSITENWVEITRIDTVAKIISGRFEFVAYPDSMFLHLNPKPMIHVTEGRFDWTYPFTSNCPLRF